jgi:aldehyde dehydrogenase (NAD+)
MPTKTPIQGQNYINGNWQSSVSHHTFKSFSPNNPDDVIGYFPLSNATDVAQAVASAKQAYPLWKAIPAPERAKYLVRIAELLQRDKAKLTQEMTFEMGKSLIEAGGDIQEAIDMAYFIAGEGRRLYGQTTPSELPHKWAMTTRQPIGVCGLITPWNFPIAVPSWKLFPCLLAGNTAVFKPAEDAPLMGQRFVELFEEAGLPAGVLNLVQGVGEEAGQALVHHPDVRLISFTGSSETGALIAEQCGRLLKKHALELGGKNACIVMEDADLDLAAEGIVWGAFGTSGQRCTATSRLLVQSSIKEALLKKINQHMDALVIGDTNQGAMIGPLINDMQFRRVLSYIETAHTEGAKCLRGGKPLDHKGYFIEPTLFDEVTPNMRIAQEEVFWPVLAVMTFDVFEEALQVATVSDYGLSSAIFTADMSLAFQAIERLEAGITYINAPSIGAEVHLPFGGVKKTGNGHREASASVLETYTELKTVYIDYSGRLQKAQIDNAESI